MPTFSKNEMKRRSDALKSLFEIMDLDCVVIHSLYNTYYIGGNNTRYWGRIAQVIVFPRDGEPTLILSKMHEHETRYSWIRDVRVRDPDLRPDHETAVGLVGQVVAEKGLAKGRIGIEADEFHVPTMTLLQAALPEAELVNISDRLTNLGVVKSAEEIEILKLCSEIADLGGAAYMDAIGVGKSTHEITAEADLAMNREIAKRMPEADFQSVSFSMTGPESLYPHKFGSGRPVEKGDIFAWNALPVVCGYYSCTERTVVVGEPTAEQRRVFEVVIDAHMRGIEALGPGVVAGDVDRLVRGVLDEAGYGAYFACGPGHHCGVGMGNPYSHGGPIIGGIRYFSEERLVEDMVVTMEPGIYIPGLGGFRHCDVLRITRDGAELLTHFDRGVLTVEA